ncbi:hypothetical protein FN846DRAFT_946959 [Sphaerosporella brunnea]|uniref:PIN domain-containing protein n=1 Tax=Sphaerosporella brunnea TaxID=1250544 RepID=A0A5J5EY78_9PEZI|nr:hypothetical protein FN846DRAFT_946959 [Sphaerosporella brunnea]
MASISSNPRPEHNGEISDQIIQNHPELGSPSSGHKSGLGNEQTPLFAAGGGSMEGVRSGTAELATQQRPDSPKRSAAEAQLIGDPPGQFGRDRGQPPARRQKHAGKQNQPFGSGRRGKQEPIDPDFDRSLPMQGVPGSPREADDPTARTTKRLFNHRRDNPGTFNAPAQQEEPSPAPRRKVGGSRPSAGILQKDHPPMPRAIVRRESNVAPVPPQSDAVPQPVPPKIKATLQPHPPKPVATQHYNDAERMVLQPETRPISPEQLIAEVKGIYAGLIMVEAKCCEVDAKQHRAALETEGCQPTLNNEQWQALIALHRTLLHEHHDFFLASQHPSASPSLKKLAQKYHMPARMWRHGIHSFLELLRHRLPHSLEHMLTFIYLAYSMMALLYETVPTFEDTWIECLGDLARYRMAIEDDDIRDREVWQNVARFWYSKAADKTPYVGRLYHHLAILARPNILQQLFFYCKSLGVSQPFTSARESILTVFDPIFNPEVFGMKSQPVDANFIQLHSITFTHIDFEKFDESLYHFLDMLDAHITAPQHKWKVQGFYVAVCNITALYQYGSRDSLLRKAWKEGRKVEAEAGSDQAPPPDAEEPSENAVDNLLPPYGTDTVEPTEKAREMEIEPESAAITQSIPGISLSVSKRLGFQVLKLTLERLGDANVMPHWHAWMVFLAHIVNSSPAIRLLENEFPWQELVIMLTALRETYEGPAERIEGSTFPVPDKGTGRPLPEDFNLRGFDWARLFPPRWFEDAQIDNEERNRELPSMTNTRAERILWLALRICATEDYLKYDSETKNFSVHPALESRLAEAKKREKAEALKQVKREETATGEDSDVEMLPAEYDSEGDDYVMVMAEPFRKLKERKRQLEAQIAGQGPVATPATIAEVSGSAIVKGPESLDQEITAFIVDTNLLISHLETFSLIASKSWSVIIPNCVITELHGLGNNAGSLGDSAKSAMIAINKVIAERKDVRIITAKGSDVTKAGFYKEKLADHDEETRNLDDVIIRTTKLQADARREVFGDRTYTAEPAVLLTEDTNMRVKANARGVPAISTTILKRFLVQMGGGRGTLTQKPRQPAPNKASSPRSKHRSVGSQIVPRVKVEDDEECPMGDVPEMADAKSNQQPKRRTTKRGEHMDDTQPYAQVH